jgi:cytochrome c-type biogenesis protein CcmH/NrfG
MWAFLVPLSLLMPFVTSQDVDIQAEYSLGHQLFVTGRYAEAEQQWTKLITWLPQLEVV